MIENIDFEPFLISLKLSFVVSFTLLIIAMPIAILLANTKSKLKPIFESLFALPIVLPPTVLGFYILVALSESSPVGGFLKEYFDISLLFSFEGLIVASCIYSFPFMLQPIQAGLESLDRSIIEASYTLGKSKLKTLIFVTIPAIKPSLITATVISFAHTMGEFGVVLMVGGNISGESKVASIAIYDSVENLDYTEAHIYSIILVITSFIVLFSVYFINKRLVK
jgi:molybdate transport system permease protein